MDGYVWFMLGSFGLAAVAICLLLMFSINVENSKEKALLAKRVSELESKLATIRKLCNSEDE